jgi:integrase
MPRPSAPWFRMSANAWYATVHGRKVSLGVFGRKQRKAALEAWHQLLAEGRKPKAEPKPEPTRTATVRAVIDGFLADAQERACPGTMRNYRLFLLPFAAQHGPRPADALTVAEAEAYARKPEWSSTYRAHFLAALVTAYRWAERGQVIARNPLQGLRKPPKASRGAKALVSAETHACLCEHADPLLRAYLQLLWLTGAGPGTGCGGGRSR